MINDYSVQKVICFLIIVQLCGACEWKPPRRTYQKAEVAEVDTDQQIAIQEPVKEEPVKEEPVKEEPVKEEPVKEEPKASLRPIVTQNHTNDYLFKIDPDGEHVIHLKQIQITDEVRRRKPKAHQGTFYSNEDYVRIFLNVRNFEGTQRLKILWIHNDQIQSTTSVKVGNSPRWRTWSTFEIEKHRHRTGKWTVEVWTRKDQLLARTQFKLVSTK